MKAFINLRNPSKETPMARILVLYATKQGQTRKIAETIADDLRLQNHTVDAFDTESVPGDLKVRDYDGVIAGAPIHMSGYPRHFRKFISKNAWAITLVPNRFFTVCMAVLENNDETKNALKNIQEKLFIETRWLPDRHVIFAGALAYTKYNWFIKWAMKRIARKAGGATDTTRDYEYTDWTQVHRFAQDFSAHLPRNQSFQSAQL